MSASALALPAPSPRDRRPIGWILGLWAAAALLVLIQHLHLQDVRADLRLAAAGIGDPGFIIPSGRWRFWGIVIPLLLLTTAFMLQFRWTKGIWRGLAGWGLLLMVPVWLVGWVMTEVSGPNGVDSVRLSDGRRFILAHEVGWEDPAFRLYEPAGPLGIHWRWAGDTVGFEYGRFNRDPGLVLSGDEKWLLMRRGGLWTDCFRLDASGPRDCGVKLDPYWSDPTFERDMRLRSESISALTGLTPAGA